MLIDAFERSLRFHRDLAELCTIQSTQSLQLGIFDGASTSSREEPRNEIQSRIRRAITEAEHGGEPCGDLSETIECNVFACDMPCELDPEWSRTFPRISRFFSKFVLGLDEVMDPGPSFRKDSYSSGLSLLDELCYSICSRQKKQGPDQIETHTFSHL